MDLATDLGVGQLSAGDRLVARRWPRGSAETTFDDGREERLGGGTWMPGGAIGRAAGRRVVTTCVLEARSVQGPVLALAERPEGVDHPADAGDDADDELEQQFAQEDGRKADRAAVVAGDAGRTVACLPNVWPLCVPLRLIVSAKYAVQRSTTTSSHHRPLMSSDVESASSIWENGMTATKAITHAMARSMQARADPRSPPRQHVRRPGGPRPSW